MSEFLAEARIIVRPDTSRFRTDLETQLQSAVRTPVKISVVPVVAPGFAGAVAGTSALAAAQQQAAAASAVTAEALASATTVARQYAGVVDLAAVSTQALGASQEQEAAVATRAAAAQAAHARSLSQLLRGAGSSGLTLFGLRGATLAASGAFLAGTAAVVAFSKAVSSAAQLQTELNVFRVTAGATADEMRRAGEEALNLGRDITLPGVTAGDAAETMTALAKAGLSVRDSFDAARGTLQLATAAQIGNAEATNLVASALNTFGLAGAEAVRVADLLTGSAKESQGEITDMGAALAQVGAVAKLAGISLEDTATFLTELARAGLSGGRAGTSLRVAILRLINPTSQAAEKLKELNVQLRDSQGNIKPTVFTDIADALEGMSRAQQQATLSVIFGTDAIRAAAIIGDQGASSFQNLRDSITQAGLAQEQAAARTQGFQGSIENLKNQFEALGAGIGGFVVGPGQLFIDFLARGVQGIGTIVEGLKLLEDAAQKAGGKVEIAVGADQGTGERIKDAILGGLADAGVFIGGGPVGGTVRAIPVLVQVGIDATKLKRDAPQVRQEIEKIVATGEQTGGEVGLNQTLVLLDQFADKLQQGTPATQKFADSVKLVRARIAEVASEGVKLFPDNVRDLFPPDLLLGTVAKEAGEANVNALEKALPGNELFGFTLSAFGRISDAIEQAGATAAETTRAAVANILRVAERELGRLGEAFDVAVAAGSRRGQLAVLRQQADEQRKIIAAENKAAQAAGAGRPGFDTAVKRRREAQHELASLNEQIRSIESQIAADAKQTAAAAANKAAEAQRARDEADRAFLASLGFKDSALQNKVLAAEATKGLADDIRTNVALRNFYKRSREEAQKTVKDADLRLQAVQAFTRQIIQINEKIDGLRKQQREAAIDRLRTLEGSVQLDIDFAQITGNQALEVRKRNEKIELLRKELVKEAKLHGKTSAAYKEVRNAIAQEKAALDDIRKEKQKANQSFAAASFEFLQAQQGFAANLLGNLIPSSATGGLVGGRSPVEGALTPVAGAFDARSQSGVTAGQGQTTNHLLAGILQQLKELNGSAATPEAQRQRRTQHAVMDGVEGG